MWGVARGGSRFAAVAAAMAGGLAVILAAALEPACESSSPTSTSTPTPSAAKSTSTLAPSVPTVAAPLDCSSDGGDWPMYGANVCNTRAATGGPIGPQTVGKLAMKGAFDA